MEEIKGVVRKVAKADARNDLLRENSQAVL